MCKGKASRVKGMVFKGGTSLAECYQIIYSPLLELKPERIIETFIALLPFPTVNRMADNYIYRFLKMTEQEELAEEFGLMPFGITTQAIERTLIDWFHLSACRLSTMNAKTAK